MEKEKIRLDKYLWSDPFIQNTQPGCRSLRQGKVKQNRESVKASGGEEWAMNTVKTENKRWLIQVAALLSITGCSIKRPSLIIQTSPPEEMNASVPGGQFPYRQTTQQTRQRPGRPRKINALRICFYGLPSAPEGERNKCTTCSPFLITLFF